MKTLLLVLMFSGGTPAAPPVTEYYQTTSPGYLHDADDCTNEARRVIKGLVDRALVPRDNLIFIHFECRNAI